ncbi:MAG: hypothetical protein WEB03_14205 [Nitriliruptor sp.]|uniref:hypothetical protein n=1 Tax=Nitriliruptor sp. TaxID=2448056 RepID=UPI0034A032DF
MPDEKLTGHRAVSLGGSPFAATVPAVVSAIGFGLLALGWLLAARWLPGGRWVVVHLFTLGVLTTLIAAFTRHFATSFTGQGAPTDVRRAIVAAVVLDASVIALLAGRLTHGRALLGLGTLGLLGVIGTNLAALRRARHAARAPRFVWIVRRYEDAHLAFLAGAVAGTTVGIGAVEGSWFAGVRDAHLHLNVLGWSGLTVLATVVVFGPALLRARMRPGADGRASTALRAAAVALAVVVVGLVVAGGAAGDVARVARVATVLALMVYGWAVVVVVTALIGAAASSDRSPLRWPIIAVGVWFIAGVGLDVVAVATVQRRMFDIVGVVLFVGVLAQLILAVLLHLAPQLRGRDFASRDVILHRTERFARSRTVLLNLGVLVVVAATTVEVLGDLVTGPSVRVGWVSIALGIAAHLAPATWPLGRVDPDQVRSASAARYRSGPDQEGRP